MVVTIQVQCHAMPHGVVPGYLAFIYRRCKNGSYTLKMPL